MREYGIHNTPEDTTRCIKEIWNFSGPIDYRQCSRKRGYGKEGLYCKQHGKIVVANAVKAVKEKRQNYQPDRFQVAPDE